MHRLLLHLRSEQMPKKNDHAKQNLTPPNGTEGTEAPTRKQLDTVDTYYQRLATYDLLPITPPTMNHYLLPTTHLSLITHHYPPPATYYPLPTVTCYYPVTIHLPPTIHQLSSTTYCSLPATPYLIPTLLPPTRC